MNVETVATQQITIVLPKGVTVKARQWTGIGDIPDSLRMEVCTNRAGTTRWD